MYDHLFFGLWNNISEKILNIVDYLDVEYVSAGYVWYGKQHCIRWTSPRVFEWKTGMSDVVQVIVWALQCIIFVSTVSIQEYEF